jgi:hypothetical protein
MIIMITCPVMLFVLFILIITASCTDSGKTRPGPVQGVISLSDHDLSGKVLARFSVEWEHCLKWGSGLFGGVRFPGAGA